MLVEEAAQRGDELDDLAEQGRRLAGDGRRVAAPVPEHLGHGLFLQLFLGQLRLHGANVVQIGPLGRALARHPVLFRAVLLRGQTGQKRIVAVTDDPGLLERVDLLVRQNLGQVGDDLCLVRGDGRPRNDLVSGHVEAEIDQLVQISAFSALGGGRFGTQRVPDAVYQTDGYPQLLKAPTLVNIVQSRLNALEVRSLPGSSRHSCPDSIGIHLRIGGHAAQVSRGRGHLHVLVAACFRVPRATGNL